MRESMPSAGERRWCWRSLSIAVAIAYVVVLAAHAVVWPWAVLLGLMAASFVGGRLLYGEGEGDAGEK